MNIRKPIIATLLVLSVTAIILDSNQVLFTTGSITSEIDSDDIRQVEATGNVRIEVAESTECNPRVTVCNEK